MPDELKVEITRVMEEMGMGEGRMPRPYIRVEFMVGPHGPFTARSPKDQFRADLMRQHLDQWARELAHLLGP